MAIIFEKIAGQIIEEIRAAKKKDRALRITQLELAELIFPDAKDPLTTYQMVVGKKRNHRRLKLGEFFDACRHLEVNFLEAALDAQRRLNEITSRGEIGSTSDKKNAKAPPGTRKRRSFA